MVVTSDERLMTPSACDWRKGFANPSPAICLEIDALREWMRMRCRREVSSLPARSGHSRHLVTLLGYRRVDGQDHFDARPAVARLDVDLAAESGHSIQQTLGPPLMFRESLMVLPATELESAAVV